MFTPRHTDEWIQPPPPFSSSSQPHSSLPEAYWYWEHDPPRYSLSDAYPDVLVPSREGLWGGAADWLAGKLKDVTMMDWGGGSIGTGIVS